MRPHLPAGATVHVTGLDALATGTDTGGLDVPVKLGVTAVAALAVLVWMFRSRLAAVPLLTAFVAIPSAFLGLLAVSPLITVHETTVIMLPLFGLAIAVDYALIVVARWREERAAGRVGDDAVHRAMATAGHTVVFSAAAVGAGLTALIVLPIPLLRSLGVGAAVVTATSAVVALVLLPLLLSRLGGAAVRPEEGAAGTWWTGWARTVVRFRVLAALGSAGVLVVLSAVALGINLHVPASADLATSGPGHTGLVALRDGGVPAGLLTAFDVFVPPGTSPAALAATLAGVAGVALATPAVTGPNGAVVTVVPQDEGGTAAGRATVERVLDAAPDGVLVGGNVTQQLEYLDATYATFPLVLALVGLVTLVTLAIAFRSPLLAVKAVLVNLLSLGAVLGALVVLWQWGWGTEALLGIRPDGAIGTFVPVTVFAFLYGLTTDYQMIILARVREEYERGGSTREAVVRGLARSGRLVTGAGMILFFSFAAMASGGELDVAIFASGVALGVLIDATLVRAVLVPASIALLGRWNWWWPRRVTNHRQPGKIGVTQP
jgi:RND superfamily putative drug exporter